MSFSSTPAASPPSALSLGDMRLQQVSMQPMPTHTPPQHTPTHTPQHSLSLQASREMLRMQEGAMGVGVSVGGEDRLGEELCGAFQQGMGISTRLGSALQSPLEGEMPGGTAQSIVNPEDKNAVNTYFDQMQAKIEAMRSAVLHGDALQAESASKELQQAVIALPAPTPSAPAPTTTRQAAAPAAVASTSSAAAMDGPSVRSSRSGSVSSYHHKQHSASNSIDSSASSPPLSFPYTTFSAPSVAGSARSLKRSASFSDWEEDEVDLDSGRLSKSMRFTANAATASDWYDEEDEDEQFGNFAQSPQALVSPVHPHAHQLQHQHQHMPPPLVHAHSFPSMHDLPSQNGTTVHDQPLASPIPPRMPTISNATIVPNLVDGTSASNNNNATSSSAAISLSRLQHLQIDTSGVGAVGSASVPASPVDYVSHPNSHQHPHQHQHQHSHSQDHQAMQSYYPIQTWVNSLGQGYDAGLGMGMGLGLGLGVGVGYDGMGFVGEQGQEQHQPAMTVDAGPGSADPYGGQQFFVIQDAMEYGFASPAVGNGGGGMDWPMGMHQQMEMVDSGMQGSGQQQQLASHEQAYHQQQQPHQQQQHQQSHQQHQHQHQHHHSAHLQTQIQVPGLAEAGTTPMPTSHMQQSQVAQQSMALVQAQAQAQAQPQPQAMSDNRSAPSLSRSASRISGIQKRPRRQASLSVVPKATGVGEGKPLMSPQGKGGAGSSNGNGNGHGMKAGLASPTGSGMPVGMGMGIGSGNGGGNGNGNGEIVPPAPPLAGIASFNFNLNLSLSPMDASYPYPTAQSQSQSQSQSAGSSESYSPVNPKVKSEVPSRPLSRQPSMPGLMGQGQERVAVDFADLNSRLSMKFGSGGAGNGGNTGRMSPVSSADGDDGDADDDDEDADGFGFVNGTGSRRASESGAAGGAKHGLSRSGSSKHRGAGGEPGHVISHASTIPPDMKGDVDRVFFEFLNRLCSNLDMTDSKGELIHQALMPKKMQKLDESPDFRPFKFRIQAFTNAFVEELNRQGFTESVLPLKKVRTYLWSQPYISRYNEDGRKSKSKGNHIWNIHAKKLPEHQGWIFREYHRKITGTPAGVAYIGLEWKWSPSIWDPQQSRSSIHPTFSSPSLPPWLAWKDNELVGTPAPGDRGGEITSEAAFPSSDTDHKIAHAFRLEVVELPAGEPLSLQKTRRASHGTDRSSGPPVIQGRNRSHTMSTAFTSESDVPPVPKLPVAISHAQQQEISQIRLVLEMAAAHIAQEATIPMGPGMPEAAVRQKQTSLAKQQEVLSRAVQAFNYVAFSLEPLPVDFSELIAASKRVVKEAARQAAERQAQSAADAPVSVGSIPMNEVIVTTRLLITKAINAVGPQASELDIMRAATAFVQQNGHAQPQQAAPPPAPPPHMPAAMLMTIDPAQLTGNVPAGFQNLASIHPAPEMIAQAPDLSSFVFPRPPSAFDPQGSGMNPPNHPPSLA